MVNTPCTIRHITLTEVVSGTRYEGPVNFEGIEKESVQGVAHDGPDQRTYFCVNCMQIFDGTETFDEVKAHLGTFPLTD